MRLRYALKELLAILVCGGGLMSVSGAWAQEAEPDAPLPSLVDTSKIQEEAEELVTPAPSVQQSAPASPNRAAQAPAVDTKQSFSEQGMKQQAAQRELEERQQREEQLARMHAVESGELALESDMYHRLLCQPDGAALGSEWSRAWNALASQPASDDCTRAFRARVEAKAAVLMKKHDAGAAKEWAAAARRDLAPVLAWLEDYGRLTTVHGVSEPAWVHGDTDSVSLAVLALIDLNEVEPSEELRRDVKYFCEGLVKEMRGDYSEYPFGAHLSNVTASVRPRNFNVPGYEAPLAGSSLFPERRYTVAALAEGYHLLGDKGLLLAAEREGLGLMAHLAVTGSSPYCFAPRPEYEVPSCLAAAACAENLVTLTRYSTKEIFDTLAGCAALQVSSLANAQGASQVAKQCEKYCVRLLENNGLSQWVGAKDLRKPFQGQVVELEDGKAVQKAFDTYPVSYPGGTEGCLASVGRENMFWMRFDVEREDPYYFYLSFFKSDVSGGMVSVMMRIDGDQIFQVNLGGATDDPFVDVDKVAGPRLLRQGPHSFGIRFSGLLMKRPALLDCILVEPAVERRWVELKDGRRLLVFNSIAEEELSVRMSELETARTAVPAQETASSDGNDLLDWGQQHCKFFNGLGIAAQAQFSRDRRERVWMKISAGGAGFMVLPPKAVIAE